QARAAAGLVELIQFNGSLEKRFEENRRQLEQLRTDLPELEQRLKKYRTEALDLKERAELELPHLRERRAALQELLPLAQLSERFSPESTDGVAADTEWDRSRYEQL